MSRKIGNDDAQAIALYQKITAITGCDRINDVRNKKLLSEPQLRDFINKQYQGRIVPVF
ncbi:hypothetical protein [Nostoc sp. NMS4]|uniref:hypothetical protein n=1 Tax=Nostoc sp. NMS4 TaxID=2815390 RepID=UPI0025ECEF53|nr:hypothetical protein [Nostoc sp. NMS4]MBN3923319.1 hypothetical protein [Nostoc sp. NMS4]